MGLSENGVSLQSWPFNREHDESPVDRVRPAIYPRGLAVRSREFFLNWNSSGETQPGPNTYGSRRGPVFDKNPGLW